MSDSPLVSVIIPSYNAAKFLVEAVQSALDQTYKNLEVHVIDDGSTDNTREIMQVFVNDPRVFYHYQSNRGEAGARNTGIRAARGQLIALCDADDVWEPRKLELQVPCFEGKPMLGVVYTDVIHVDGENREIPTHRTTVRHNGKITEKLLLENFVTGSASVIRRECFDDEMYDETLKTCADYDLWLRLSVKYEFFYLDEVTYRYRQWSGQVSNPRNELRFYDDSAKARASFLARYPDIVSSEVVRELWADLFAGRGMTVMRLEHNRWAALQDVARALKFRPVRILTWKAAAKILLNRVY